MTIQIDFDYYFGEDIKLNITADVTLGPSHNPRDEPGEADTAEIVTCVIEDEDTHETIDFPVGGIFYWSALKNKPIELEAFIVERAINIVAESE